MKIPSFSNNIQDSITIILFGNISFLLLVKIQFFIEKLKLQ